MQRSLLLAMGLLILALVACGCTTQPGQPAPVSTTVAPPVPPGSPIVGSWVLESLVDEGRPALPVPGTTITATFGQDGTFSGSDGCNQQSGSYTVSGSQIRVGPALISTAMACEPAVMGSADIYNRILTTPGSWQVAGDRLTIQDTPGLNKLVYVKQVSTPPRASPAGSWELTAMTIVSGGSSLVKMPSGTITATFGTDGKVQGSGGCNEYSGAYTTAGSSITVKDVITTLRSCGNVLDTQERAYLAILGDASTFENAGTALTILTGSSPPGKLAFKPAPTLPTLPVPAIVGAWGLTAMTKDGTHLTPVGGSRPTATFSGDGKLSGTTGCNQYSGTYVLPGTASISVGPLATTKKACADPLMNQEDTYLGILGNAAGWEVSGGTLTIRDNTPAGNTLVYAVIVQ